MPKPYDPYKWEYHQNLDFATLSPAQKEVLARENAHCSRTFQASLYDFKTRYCPDPTPLDGVAPPPRYYPGAGRWGVW